MHFSVLEVSMKPKLAQTITAPLSDEHHHAFGTHSADLVGYSLYEIKVAFNYDSASVATLLFTQITLTLCKNFLSVREGDMLLCFPQTEHLHGFSPQRIIFHKLNTCIVFAPISPCTGWVGIYTRSECGTMNN